MSVKPRWVPAEELLEMPAIPGKNVELVDGEVVEVSPASLRHGLIATMLAGEISREEAIERAVTATRQYAKRQSTWFRNRMGDWRFVDPFGA